MSPVPSKTVRRRMAEGVAWLAGIAASGALALGVYNLAAAPFITDANDPLALPKELAVTSGTVPIPLPAELTPNGKPVAGVAKPAVEPAAAEQPAGEPEPTTTTPSTVPADLLPGATTNTSQPQQNQQQPTVTQAPATTQAPRPTTPATQPPAPPTTAADPGNNLDPIVDPVTGLVRGAVSALQEDPR